MDKTSTVTRWPLPFRPWPQSQGLPPIEQYRNDYPQAFDYDASHETEFSARDIFMKHVLSNRLLWMIALANAFVYFVRYGVLDWAPTYLGEVKQFSFEETGWAYAFYEFAGIPGTLLCGWMSDRVFGGRRAPASILFMLATLICVVVLFMSAVDAQARDWKLKNGETVSGDFRSVENGAIQIRGGQTLQACDIEFANFQWIEPAAFDLRARWLNKRPR